MSQTLEVLSIYDTPPLHLFVVFYLAWLCQSAYLWDAITSGSIVEQSFVIYKRCSILRRLAESQSFCHRSRWLNINMTQRRIQNDRLIIIQARFYTIYFR